jgi:hypothetical protein
VLPTQVRSTECCTGAVADPDKTTVEGEFVALLTNEMDPEKGPLVSGTKLTFTFALPPAATENGTTAVDRKTPPVMFAADTDTAVLPVFDSVTVWFDVFPTNTLPNATLEGDALRVRVEGTVAAPDRLTTGGVLDALLVSVSAPWKLPAAVGANWTGSAAD